jgi:dihydroflavonol-4-reductase
VRALVTGATGLVGGNIARALRDDGWDVAVTVRSDVRALAGLTVDRVAADLADEPGLTAAMRGCDAVFHAAAAVWIGRTGRADLERVNVAGTETVCRAARDARVRRLVHVSSVDALGIRTLAEPADEDTPPNMGWLDCAYVDTKCAAEAVVLRYAGDGLDAVVVNPAYMLGPWDVKPSSGRMLLAVHGGQAVLAPGGGNCFLDVRDAARGAILALERGVSGRRYILGGENLPYLDAWTRFAKILGVRPPLGRAPAWGARLVGAAAGLWTRAGFREPDVNPVSAAMGELPHYFSSARAKAELGFPDTDLDRAVTDAFAWFRANGYA